MTIRVDLGRCVPFYNINSVTNYNNNNNNTSISTTVTTVTYVYVLSRQSPS